MTAMIDAQGFRAGLLRDGFTASEASRPPGPPGPPHSHEFHARGLILEGSFTLTIGGVATTFRPGEVFSVGAGTEHIEQAGPQGVRLLAGRKLAR